MENIIYHNNDLPEDILSQNHSSVAIDTEAMGLNNNRDRLCVVQLSFGDGVAHIVHLSNNLSNANDYCKTSPNLKKLLIMPEILKIFHFARFDVAILQHSFNIIMENLYCTKIASRLARTYTDNHGLKDLCYDLLNIKLSKQQQSSDWGADQLTNEQLEYAAKDVLYLHQLKEKLDSMLTRENRTWLAKKCFDFIPARAYMDVKGWGEDILEH